MINLLFQFKINIESLRAEIVAKGTPDAILDKIIGYADQLKAANITQEGTKGTRKGITEEAIIEFNKIYNKVISVAKITAKFYKDNPAQKDQFSFTKVKKGLNLAKSSTPTPPTP